MVFILAYRTKYHIRAKTILHIDSKPHIYFMIKDVIKHNRLIAGPQSIKRKDNSNIKNCQSQIA